MTEEVLISVEEAARRLHIGRSKAFSLIKHGHLASVKIGSLRRVPVSALHEYVQCLHEDQAAEAPARAD